MTLKQQLYRYLFFRLGGWRIVGDFPTAVPQMVMAVVPHTHAFDFFIGLFTRGIIGEPMHFVGKKELFVFPLGAYFRWMGGYPLDRTGHQHKVQSIAALFQQNPIFRLAIAPEGTRRKVDRLRSGFYHIAMTARVPILPVAFDYRKREVRLGPLLYPTGQYEADLEILCQTYRAAQGYRAYLSFDCP